MGRTWRKNSEFGHKSNFKDEQRRLKKEVNKAQKSTQKGGEQASDFWDRVRKTRGTNDQ